MSLWGSFLVLLLKHLPAFVCEDASNKEGLTPTSWKQGGDVSPPVLSVGERCVSEASHPHPCLWAVLRQGRLGVLASHFF